MLWRRRLDPITRPLAYALFRWRRGLTLGVRGVVLDADGRVLLIEHTYVHGWHLPGGGVEHGESAAEALARELVEEAGVQLTAPPRLLSIHNHHAQHPRDHVLVYRCDRWTPCAATARGEIHGVGWFAPDDLPAGTTGSTRRRIREALGEAEADELW